MVILVDTNIIIDFLRVADKQETLYYKLFVKEGYASAISFVTAIELLAGREMDKPEKRKVVKSIIKESLILEGSTDFYNLAGEILRQNIIQFQDALIASHAILNKIPLLTKNIKDFRKVKGIKFFNV